MVSPSSHGPATGDTQCWQLSALPGLSSYRALTQTTSPRNLNAVERNCGSLCSEVTLSMPKIFLIRQGLEEQQKLLAGLNRSKPGTDLWPEPDILNHQDEAEALQGKSLLSHNLCMNLKRKLTIVHDSIINQNCLVFTFLCEVITSRH